MMNALSKVAEKLAGEVPTETPASPPMDSKNPMCAIVWNGKTDVEFVKVGRPMLADDRDVILKVTATTICGSDLHLYRNTMPTMHRGDILGHEFMGTIHETGSKVTNLHKGQRVAVSFNIACGECKFCKLQEYTSCDVSNPSKLQENMYGARSAALFGYSHVTGGVPGGQAEYVRVPFAEFNCLPIPDEIPDEKALYLTDVIPTALHGTECAEVKEGDTVAIWGLGPIGLMTARWCQIKKASRIIGIDQVPERLEMAKSVLNIEVLNFAEENTVKTLLKMFPTGVDCAIECVGFDYPKTFKHKAEMAMNLETDSADIFSEMFTAVRKAGHVGVIGVYTGFANHFPVGAMMEKGLTVRGGQAPVQKYWDYCLDMIKSGEIDPTFMITHRGSLREAPEMYEQFLKKNQIKVFLKP